MKQDLMQLLVCPVCKGELELSITEKKNGEIIAGSLICRRCPVDYTIIDGIPHMLPKDCR